MTKAISGRVEQSPAPVRLDDMRNLFSAARAMAEVQGKRAGLAGSALSAYVNDHWERLLPEAKAAVASVRGPAVLRSRELREAAEDMARVAASLKAISAT